MPKGTGKKPDHLKPGETPKNGIVQNDDLSAVDKGWDFVKPNESAQIGRESH